MKKQHEPDILMAALQLLTNQYIVTFALFEDTGFPEIDKKLHEARVKFADTTILLMQCMKVIENDRHQNLMSNLEKFDIPIDYRNEDN